MCLFFAFVACFILNLTYCTLDWTLVQNLNVRVCVCVCVHPGSGCHALSWCRSVWTRSWTKRRCWKAGNPTFASLCKWPTTVPCNTAARCRETPAVKPATVTEHTHAYINLRFWSLQDIRFSTESPTLHHRTQTVPVAQIEKTPTTLARRRTHSHTKLYLIWHVKICI